MKFTVERRELATACKTATVANLYRHLEVLDGLRLDAAEGLKVTGTNLDLTVTVDLPAQVGEPGSVIIPARLLRSLVESGTDDTVTVSVLNNEATIECGATVAVLRTHQVEDWPRVQLAEGDRFQFTVDDLDRISRTLHAVLTDPKKIGSSPASAGVHFEANRVETYDTHQCAVAILGCDGLPDVVVPAEVVSRIVNMAGVSVTFSDHLVTFTAEGVTWTSTLIAAAFPKVFDAIPRTHSHELTVNRAALSDALRRVSVIVDPSELTHAVDLLRDGDVLRLVTSRMDVGNVADEVACSGTWVEPLRFHERYLANLLNAQGEDEVTFELSGALKPVLVHSSDQRLVLLVQPVKR